MAKKTVKFGRFAGLVDHKTKGAVMAVLYDVQGHYRLGNCDSIITSAVVKIEHDDKNNVVRIETLNTIYEKTND